jgi:DNA-binding IscR family transcriptional regulator
VSESGHRRCDECIDERTCGVPLVMKEVRDATSKMLDSTTLADIIQRVASASREKEPINYVI